MLESLGRPYGALGLLVLFGSIALVFVVPRPRLLWASLLAAVGGLGEALLVRYALPESEGQLLPWLFLAPVLLGAGFARRERGWRGLAAGWLGIPFGIALAVGTVFWGPCWNCGELLDELWTALIVTFAGAVLAAVGALLVHPWTASS
jgi:hypothetical protein